MSVGQSTTSFKSPNLERSSLKEAKGVLTSIRKVHRGGKAIPYRGSGSMKQVELAVGLALIFVGAGFAIYMLTVGPHTYYSREAYTTYALGGGALAVLGLLMAVYGFASRKEP